MPLNLSSPVTDIARIGPAKAQYLQKLKITHARDFLYTFPRRYDDFSTVTAIEKLKIGDTMTVYGRVKKVQSDWGYRGRRRMLRIYVDIGDDTGVLSVIWYNLRFLPKQLWPGRELYIAGKVESSSKSPAANSQPPHASSKLSVASSKLPVIRLRMRSPVLEFANTQADQTHTGRITPVYPETYGVTSRFLRYHVKNMLPLIDVIPEYLPSDIRRRNHLIGIHTAIKQVHFPDSTQQLEKAPARLRFHALFFLQLAALVRRMRRHQEIAPIIRVDSKPHQKFVDQLPFQLTTAQQSSLQDILQDITRATPMNRLLQGDVGSGKSAVALVTTFLVLHHKYKVLYLAPTEILARQQAASFTESLGEDKVTLLLGASTRRERDNIKEQVNDDAPICLVGTHALLQDDIKVKHLGLAVVDEQHRFGVKQRQALQKHHGKTLPHLLSMTATPIPRTLNLTVYGDLDVSIMDEMPPGRQDVTTSIVPDSQREQAFLEVLNQIHAGRQAYAIAPLVEQSDVLQVKSAQETYSEMTEYFPGIAIELIHGKMSSDAKQAIMENFSAGAIQLLVATSVVEVGVNVPNATCMIIEGAERFGLAQLHQMRGRVGRGEHKSTCYLFPSTEKDLKNERLKILAETSDGFEIAEQDLRLRGPGELYGTSQSGFSDLKVASLLDYPTIKKTRTEAEKILKSDPELKAYPILQKKVAQKNLVTHFE